MKVNRVRQNVFPVAAAMIWGTSFVAQSVSADYVEAFTFNTARSIVAFLFLLVLCVVLRRMRSHGHDAEAKGAPQRKCDLLIGGICCGVALTVASNLQQKGLETTTQALIGSIGSIVTIVVAAFGGYALEAMGLRPFFGLISVLQVIAGAVLLAGILIGLFVLKKKLPEGV